MVIRQELCSKVYEMILIETLMCKIIPFKKRKVIRATEVLIEPSTKLKIFKVWILMQTRILKMAKLIQFMLIWT